jgi:hypothetical protein
LKWNTKVQMLSYHPPHTKSGLVFETLFAILILSKKRRLSLRLARFIFCI